MHHTTVEIEAENRLSKAVWTFWFDDSRMAIILDSYREYTRPTTRHKYNGAATSRYERLSDRNCTMPVEQVPLPEEIKQRAKQQVIDALWVGTMPEWNAWNVR